MTHHCVNMNHIPLGEFFAFLFQRDKYLTHLPHLPGGFNSFTSFNSLPGGLKPNNIFSLCQTLT